MRKNVNSIETLDEVMGNCWQEILSSPLALEIQQILASGDKTLYALWLCQVAHLTKHTSAHQAMVGVRINEISHAYAKFCFEHAAEEVGHEMMAVHDLRKVGYNVHKISDLPMPLIATEKLNAYLYYVSQFSHPATRLGFSYWAEKCYPFIHALASETKASLGLSDKQMTFFVSHGEIDEKHAIDVEKIIRLVCIDDKSWGEVSVGLKTSLQLATDIFKEIFHVFNNRSEYLNYDDFLKSRVD